MNAVSRILVVDDEPNLRLLFKTALSRAEYQICTAEDGESALLWLGSDHFDLVLLDLRMPKIGGMDVLESLRAAGDETPAVVITAHGSVPDAVAALKLGAVDFLSKPLAPNALRQVVAEVLARHKTSADDEPVTADGEFAAQLARAKRALNRRSFEEAGLFLKQALALKPESAEAHNLRGVLHELCHEYEAAYREYREALRADRHYEPAAHNMRRYYERSTFGSSDVSLDLGQG